MYKRDGRESKLNGRVIKAGRTIDNNRIFQINTNKNN